MAVPNRIQRARTLVKRDFYSERNKQADEIRKIGTRSITEEEHKARVGLLKELGLIKEVKKIG